VNVLNTSKKREIFLKFIWFFSFLENFSHSTESPSALTLSLTHWNPTTKWPGDGDWNLTTAAHPEWPDGVHGGPEASSAGFPRFAKFQLWRCSLRD